MYMIDEDVKKSVIDTLNSLKLFRYDCDSPEESPVAKLEHAFAKAVGLNMLSQ